MMTLDDDGCKTEEKEDEEGDEEDDEEEETQTLPRRSWSWKIKDAANSFFFSPKVLYLLFKILELWMPSKEEKTSFCYFKLPV